MYTGIKEVRKCNGQKFIDDFKSTSSNSIGVNSQYSGFYRVGKMEVWRMAKDTEIMYLFRSDIYRNGRRVMVII